MVGIFMESSVEELIVVFHIFIVDQDFPFVRIVEAVHLFTGLSGKNNRKELLGILDLQ